jgi:protein BCP1
MSLTLSQLSSHTHSYTFTSSKPREKDSFGLDTGGRMMLVEAGRLPELIGMMAEKYVVPG